MPALPLVSVIIPAFNAGNTILQAIESAKKQTYPNLEIIICDDGSTDNTAEIVNKVFGKSIQYIFQEKQNAAVARNRALESCKGQFIQFLDADDLLSEEKIEQQMAVIANSNESIAISKTIFFTHSVEEISGSIDLSTMPVNPIEFLEELYLSQRMVAIHAMLFHKDLLRKNGSFDERLTFDDDGDFSCRLILAAKEIIHTKGIAYYRKGETSSLSNANGMAASQSALQACINKIEAIENKYGKQKASIIGSKLISATAYHYLYRYPALLQRAKLYCKEKSITMEATGGKNFRRLSQITGIDKALALKRLLAR